MLLSDGTNRLDIDFHIENRFFGRQLPENATERVDDQAAAGMRQRTFAAHPVHPDEIREIFEGPAATEQREMLESRVGELRRQKQKVRLRLHLTAKQFRHAQIVADTAADRPGAELQRLRVLIGGLKPTWF